MTPDPLHTVDLPSQSIVEDALLCALNMHTRPVDPPVMYDLLAERFNLTAQQRHALLQRTKENAWHNLVRQARRRLKDLGYIDRSISRQWLLSEAGRAKAREREWQKSRTADDLGL
ncbi:MAG TPA: winged helix-turn-helix domain-containing protein [Rhizomicrobium sp.]|nr:winged helix-turn-helix domain-containing protein [Rhizomicrobium sp.]